MNNWREVIKDLVVLMFLFFGAVMGIFLLFLLVSAYNLNGILIFLGALVAWVLLSVFSSWMVHSKRK